MPTVIDLSSLGGGGFVIQGDAAFDRAGFSVSSAGDVDGDGFGDVIVGAPYGDDAGAMAGEAYVIYGKADGFATIDLTALALADGFIIQGDAAFDRAGYSVSSAGDVNGDGFDDIVVGARDGDDGGANAGEAYVIFGRASGFANIDLTGLAPADGFVIQGDTAGDQAGFSVSSAGDVNGDGYDDIIVGAQLGDDGGADAGEAYVIFGKASGFGTIDLTGLAAPDGFRILGDAAGDRAGCSVSSAGDINGDTYDDLIVGASLGDNGGVNAGEAYVIFGKAGVFGAIDLTGLAAADGFVIQGDSSGDRAGFDVASAGDINRDGFDDIVVGAPFSDAGTAYVLFGKASGFANIDLTGLSAADGFIVLGDTAADRAGLSVSSAGDVNGDGFGDIIVGAPYGDDGGSAAGEAYVVYGKADGFGTIDLTDLAPADGFVIQGDAAGERVGFSVSAAGDVDGDGFDDIVVGAFGDDDGGNYAGKAIVVFGGPGDFPSVLDLSSLGMSGFIVQGDAPFDTTGASVSDAGDVNGDGFDDIIVGAHFADDGGTSSGAAYVIFGKASGFATVDLTSLGAQGFIIQGDNLNDMAGFSVSSAGDVNGDGFDDVIVGAPDDDYGGLYGTTPGLAYVIFGKASGFATIDLTTFNPADANHDPAEGFAILGDAHFDKAGTSVSSAGDVNSDGFDDMIVSATQGDEGGSNAGEAYVIFGKASGFGLIDLAALAPGDGFLIHGDSPFELAGIGVSAAGDVNGDGFGDVIVGAYRDDEAGSDAGAAYVIFGKASGFGTIDLGALAPADGFAIEGAGASDYAGNSVSAAGDVNGDGFDDIIVGAAYGNEGGTNAGAAYVIFGRAAGFATIDLAALAPAEGFLIQGDFDADLAGTSVSAAGDINGDGFDDIIVGAPDGDDGGTSAGEAYVIFGKASGFGAIDLETFDPADPNHDPANGFIIQGDFGGDKAGYSVSAAGDVNGDGFADMIVGAPYGDDGGTNSGEAYVIFGRAPMTAVTRTGSAANQTIRGGAFNDTLDGRGGADILIGAAGDDRYVVDNIDDLVVEAVNGGYDSVSTLVDYTLAAGSHVERLTSISWALTTNLRLTGNELVNRIEGNAGDNVLNGGAGADTLVGFGGNDQYVVDNAGDVVVEAAGGGSDFVSTVVDYTLAAGVHVERLTSISWALTTNLRLTGNELVNRIEGNAGDNVLNGGAAADTLVGFGGNDQYVVDNAGDVVVEAAGGGSDFVSTVVDYTLAAGVHVERLTSISWALTTNLRLTGNELVNRIEGNAGDNVLNGGGGADTLVGFGGNDQYVVDNAGDVVVEASGAGSDFVSTVVDYTLAAGVHVERLTSISWALTTNLRLTGNELVNRIEGNAGDNALDGKLGADTLVGFAGADTFAFTTALNGGVDAIADFEAGIDTIALDDAVFAGLTPGALNANAFVIGSAAQDADDRIVYDSGTGQLFYDSDGSGAGGAVLFATLQGAPIISAGDFTVI